MSWKRWAIETPVNVGVGCFITVLWLQGWYKDRAKRKVPARKSWAFL